ncbi:MAG: 1-(5-phosphoribosyl)-5-[(5-phosphoribosylamino)methylideneamino]imidazole-4-carboxamide isomerase [Clostridiales bacterium]|nr:1-(5-phosphoribosyl)-5-[(5-phosphoribosylamino)methylideneamino]imidazole-4-carboxamide isomerase [Clostridiales bacterium]
MIILPAIDIYRGECVRLTQGAFHTSERVADSWLETAASFEEAGAKWIHMVDLDGAISGERVNSHIFIEVAKKTGLKVELGGGIRTMEDISYYLEQGISRVVLGSAAIDDPSLVEAAVKKYCGRIAVAIDAMNGMVKTSGWVSESGSHYIEIAKKMEASGAEVIIYTDIAKDGTLNGPSISHLESLKNAVSSKIIASGGIRNSEDIRALCQLGLYGSICGKSIYQGSLDLRETLSICKEEM